MADSSFAQFDLLSAVKPGDYLVGYRNIRETRVEFGSFLQNSVIPFITGGETLKLQSVYSTTNTNSGTWNGTYTTLNTNSSVWNSTYTTLNNNSGIGLSVYSNLNTNSARWNSVYSTVNTNSGNYILDGGNTKGSNLMVGTNDNFDLTLETNGNARATIKNSGNVGIGVTSPLERLTVVGNISALSAVYTIGCQPGLIPFCFKTRVFDLSSAINTTFTVYTVPANMTAIVKGHMLVITAAAGSPGASFLMPTIRVENAAAQGMMGSIALRSTTYNVNDCEFQNAYGATRVVSNNVINLTFLVGMTGSSYTSLSGYSIVEGYLF